MSHPEAKRVRQPRPLWAGVLSFVFPGLGQIYVGALRLGVILFVLGLASHLVLIGLTRVSAPVPAAVAVFIFFGLIGVLYRLATAVAAFRLMRGGFQDETGRRWYQSTWIAAIVMVAISILTNVLMAPNASDLWGWRSLRVASGSGLPTLRLGDYVMADVRPPGSLPVPGDIIVFRHPQAANWTDRLIAVAGDTVQMRNGRLHLNGKQVPRTPVDGRPGQYRETLPNGRSYIILEKTDNGPADNTPEFRVPGNSFFVMGDNRDDSLDSRAVNYVGYVPQANLTGVIYTVYWSPDFSRLLLRLE